MKKLYFLNVMGFTDIGWVVFQLVNIAVLYIYKVLKYNGFGKYPP